MKSLLLILTLAVASGFALGKSAADYFHDAAYKYVAGRHQEASVEADEGLRAYPGDPQLQMLSDLLKQMKDQQRQDQNQGGGSQNKQDQNKQNQNQQNGKNGQNKDQQNKDQNQNGQNGSKDQKDQKNSKNPNKQNPQNKQPSPQDTTGQGKDQKSQQNPPQQNPENSGADSLGKNGDTAGAGQAKPLPGQMSKEDAERLLNSFIDEENQAQQNRLGTPHKPVQGGQNW